MQKDSRIYIAGNWLVWSAIKRNLINKGFENIISPTHSELDLTNWAHVDDFFMHHKPEYVILAAAKVWGIIANNTMPAEFIYSNLQIQNNVIHAAYKYNVTKLLFLWSSCIYPKLCPQPIKEEYLLTWPLEPTNEPYAIAKISGIKMCQSFNRQYGTNFIACMPTNLYWPGDNFNLTTSHVMPAMMRKFHEAKENNAENVTLWWDGSPMREFLHVDDMAEACIHMMEHFNPTKEDNENGNIFFNIGTGEDTTIKDLAYTIKEIIWYEWEIVWDTTKPNWTPRKLLDVSKINDSGRKAKIRLKDWIQQTYTWFMHEQDLSPNLQAWVQKVISNSQQQ